MAPVERTKWMTSAWDRTIDHACVHCVSRPTMDCSGDRVFTVELLWTLFHKLLPPPTPTPALGLPPAHPPTPLATLAQNWCAPPSEMASNQVSNKYQATLKESQ